MRAGERRALVRLLDEHALTDIGMSRADAPSEAINRSGASPGGASGRAAGGRFPAPALAGSAPRSRRARLTGAVTAGHA